MVAGAALNSAREAMTAATPWLRWRQPVVRDLAWVIASPPLLRAPAARRGDGTHWLDDGWCAQALALSEDWLAALDRDPSTLLVHLAGEHDHRLGSHFESLLAFWLAWPENPLYTLIARNLPVRDEGRTLGEFDFLVRERSSGEVQHWEVAVKFFLGVQPGGEARHWVGPGLRDRLDLKLEHLRLHQLRLGRSPGGRRQLAALGLEEVRPVCLVKGCLFYPAGVDQQAWAPRDAAPGHLQGWWQDHTGFLSTWGGSDLRWLRLPKASWMTAVIDAESPEVLPDAHALVAGLPTSGPRSAICVIGLRDRHESTRGFVVAPGWPAQG